MDGLNRPLHPPGVDLGRPLEPASDARRNDEPRLQLDAPALSLPKGGGAIRGIDEKFTVNPSNGTVSLSLALPLSAARNGFVPPVRLSYNSGSGNSVVGLGWSIDLPSIRRRTDHRLPRYRDDDTFLLNGAEELVPAVTWNIDRWDPDTTQFGAFVISRYRPRIEGDFARIEHIAHPTLGTWWRVTSRDNVTTFFGSDDTTRIFNPSAPEKVFHWLPALSFDDQGNCLVYQYKPEDLTAVARRHSEANRRNGNAGFANKHLKRLNYGNRVPCAPDAANPYVPPVPAGTFMFQAVFDYGEHDANQPTPAEAPGQLWPARADPFSSYRSGFDIRTYRLLQRVLMFHQFDELAAGAPCLVRSLDFAYVASAAGSSQATDVTYLASASQCGYANNSDGSYSKRSLPPVALEYEPLHWHTTIATVDPDSVANLPSGATDGYNWIDLFGEGIAGLFTEQTGAWFYKANLGDVGETGTARLDANRRVLPKPSFAGMRSGVLQFADLAGDGRTQVLVHSPEMQGYFDRGDDGEWLPFRSFDAMVRIALDDQNLRMLDLDGDGRTDLLITEENALVWYGGEPRGYRPAERSPKPYDEERGPAVVFAEADQTIFLADMTGDGLFDIVRLRSRDICYWPNLGYGRFGAKVAMDNAPDFAPPDQFAATYLHLADVSGTGASDILYLGPHGCTGYLNLSGNAWSAAQPIAPFFPTEAPNQIAATDLLGNGTACIVWSSTLPAHAGAPMRYIDLMGGRKPHLLRKYINNFGKEVSFSYKSSTWFYLKDKLEDRPWATRLPFPVHCLRQMEVSDLIAGTRFVTDLRYHHGYYDRVEREFCGFGMVEQRDAETFAQWAQSTPGHLADRSLHQTPVLTKTWFHTGAVADRASVLTRFRDEYWDREMARQGFAVTVTEPSLPDARLLVAPGVDPNALSPLRPEDWREAMRACKGMVLRKEVFGLDAPDPGATAAERQRQLSPYTVSTHNCMIELLQPVRGAAHAVFVVEESEAVTWTYERDPANPRIEHKLNIAMDEYGNVLESASVAYGRAAADMALPNTTRAMQARTAITYVQTELTGDAIGAAFYRLRRGSRATTFEITGLPRAQPLYRIGDFASPAFSVLINSVEIPFADTAATPPSGTVFRRRLRCKETLFYDASLSAALPLHQLHYRALPYESYELAFTADLLAIIFAGRAADADMIAGGYVHRGDAGWWAPSGRWSYLAGADTVTTAAARFFVPVGHVDSLGAATAIGYFGNYFLLRNIIEDAARNVTTADAFDLRALTPVQLTDPNGNISELLLDELGWVKATATRGKGTEGDDLNGLAIGSTAADGAAHNAFLAAASSVELAAAGKILLQHASARFVYDPLRYVTSGGTAPPLSATVQREQHAAVLADSPLQISFEYSNGLGKVEQRKVQAEPGLAKRVTLTPPDAYTVDTIDTALLAPPRLRWLGTGRRLLNNKGNPVKEYEPFFSVSHGFEIEQELVESGVTVTQSYDPVGRVVRTDYPDGSFSRTDFTAWLVAAFDRNDTVLESAWHSRRVNREIDPELIAAGKDPVREAQAAAQTEAHAATPLTRHLDPLGRPVLDIEHDGFDATSNPILYRTTRVPDITGDLLRVEDARANTSIAYAYDMRGRTVAHTSMDSGRRWMLDTVLAAPLRSWDERGHEFVFAYDDPLHRPTSKKVRGGDGPVPLDNVFELIIYGEGQPNDTVRNLRGRVALLYDTAGRTENVSFDFKGNLTSGVRRFASLPKAVPDWSGVTPDTALLPEALTSAAAYDALDRLSKRTTADGSITALDYNAANLPGQIRLTQGAISETFVSSIDYDEKGQRRSITHGNGVLTTYRYDPQTFRLIQLTSVNGAGATLQDLVHTYDAVGNVTHLEDRAVPAAWFNNQLVLGLATYRYAPTYRLVQAAGREHVAQVDFGAADNWNDAPFRANAAVGDPALLRGYTQTYAYDAVGNLTKLQHVAAGGGWTRDYTYAPDSNRLVTTKIGGTTFVYTHHPAHGYLTAMPHLTVMAWNFRDELSAVATQAINSGAPETTWYVYDGQGRRVRKITERAAAAGATPVRRSERYYLDGVEIYREYDATDALTLERRTRDVTDDRQRVAMIDTEGATRLVRYQGVDHLQSAHLETDVTGRVISYEEYHPFGTTAYQAVDKAVVAAAKRYRYTGMERDDESGLEYHSARYYAPWLGRWIAPDHHPDKLDGDRYAYVKNNPIVNRDSNGMFEEPTHGILTYRLAIAAGFPPADAARVAIATAAMDHDAATSPAGVGDIAQGARIGQTVQYHYPTAGSASALADVRGDIAAQRSGSRAPDDLERFGRHLHTLEDVGFSDAPGPHMRHDPGRPLARILSPTLGMLGLALASGMTVAAIHLAESSMSTGAKLVLGILIGVALAFGVYMMALGFATEGIGHPSYLTERGENSMSFAHTADQAPQDPAANTKEMLKVYGELKDYARARYGATQSDDVGAKLAIQQAVTADNSCLVSNFANQRPLSLGGVPLPSYSEILATRTADRGRSWLPQDMDVTNPANRGDWHYTPGNRVCPR